MSILPTALSQPDPTTLQITWSDGLSQTYQLQTLQNNCPCATCRDDAGKAALRTEADNTPAPSSDPFALPMLTPQEAQPLRLTGVDPVGNYAYAIRFNHGCGHGIYRFELLRALGEPQPEG